MVPSYLSSRSQFVSVANSILDLKPVHGVPQGSVPFSLRMAKCQQNTEKTEYIVFKGRSKCFGDIEVVLGGQKLNRSQNLKYLGVLINEHLNWKARISTLCSKPMEPCRKFTIMPLQTFFSTTIILYPVRT